MVTLLKTRFRSQHVKISNHLEPWMKQWNNNEKQLSVSDYCLLKLMEPHNFKLINKNNRLLLLVSQISIDHVKCNRKFPVFWNFVRIDTLFDDEIESTSIYEMMNFFAAYFNINGKPIRWIKERDMTILHNNEKHSA